MLARVSRLGTASAINAWQRRPFLSERRSMCVWPRHRASLARQFSLMLLIFLWGGPLQAQSPDASVRGSVTSSDGRPVIGAKVTATQFETGFSPSTKTDSRGQYYFGSLPRGVYSLKVEILGY